MHMTTSAITFRLGGRTLLDEVSFSAEPGRVLGLLGPNGAGKSTLLRCLAGLVPEVLDQVFLDGEPLSAIQKDRLPKLISYLPQREEIYWPMSVEAVVGLGRLAHRRGFGAQKDLDRKAVEKALALTGTASIRHRSVAGLSGGESMRTLVARMLAVEAEVLLADEPVSGLDPGFQLQFLRIFRNQAAAGRTLVLVLHDLALAARFCDQLLLLDKGRILAAGPPPQVLEEGLLRRVYGVEVLKLKHAGEDLVLPWKTMENTELAPHDTRIQPSD